jgi:hypothetical protein
VTYIIFWLPKFQEFALQGFYEQFSDCFYRSESRDHFFKYMAGQFSDLERKSIEPIALSAISHRRFKAKMLFNIGKI